MPIFGAFTQAIEKAWGYIESAFERGIGAAEGFTQFVRGGGDITQEEFAGGYGTREEAGKIWEGIKAIPSSYKVSQEFGIVSTFDWAQKHVMKMEVEYTDLQTGVKGSQWITVESDTELSMAEWEAEAQSVVMDSPMGYQYWVESVSDYQYYLRE